MRGTDVYLFLIGMMVLAEVARRGGLFDWVAERAIDLAGGSHARLFALVFAAGIVTTMLLSNDATIVVLTPAVIVALRRSSAPPVAYVMACALVANAASFLLPIANPANLLVFAGRMPALTAWLQMFALPSVAALLVTFAVVAVWFQRDLRGNSAPRPAPPSQPNIASAIVLALAAIVIVTTSALQGPLGAATAACAAIALAIATLRGFGEAVHVVRNVSWSVIALTAALFIIVATVDAAGGFALAREVLARCATLGSPWSSVAIGFAVAAASNIINNLPVGLNLGATLPAMHAAPVVTAAALVGVNLGPNATVNGSLATLLWLTIVRRERIDVSPVRFAVIGTLATIPALFAALLLVR